MKEEWKSTKSFYYSFLRRKAQHPARIETVCRKKAKVDPGNHTWPIWTEICCSTACATTAALHPEIQMKCSTIIFVQDGQDVSTIPQGLTLSVEAKFQAILIVFECGRDSNPCQHHSELPSNPNSSDPTKTQGPQHKYLHRSILV